MKSKVVKSSRTLQFFFDNNQLNWLNPTRYLLLIGGHWDHQSKIWITSDGRHIEPETSTWNMYFGDIKPNLLNFLFPRGSTWNDIFGWMTIEFFDSWKGWENRPQNIIPPFLIQFFQNGQMNWLNPDRYQLLIGGRWDPIQVVWVTADGRLIRPGSVDWQM
jgi:hypothetical protein